VFRFQHFALPVFHCSYQEFFMHFFHHVGFVHSDHTDTFDFNTIFSRRFKIARKVLLLELGPKGGIQLAGMLSTSQCSMQSYHWKWCESWLTCKSGQVVTRCCISWLILALFWSLTLYNKGDLTKSKRSPV
jgi:hypothetical protein